MSAAIAEPSAQAAAIPPGTATAPTGGTDRPPDAFMSMLAAVLDTRVAPSSVDAGQGSPPTPIIATLAKSADPTQPTGVAIVPPAPPDALLPVAAPEPADLAPIATVPDATAARATARPSLAKVATPTTKSGTTDPDPVPEIAPPTPGIPPVLSSIILPLPDPPLRAVEPTARGAAIVSAPVSASAEPPPPARAGAVAADPLPAEDPAKPHDRVADGSVAAIPDRPPDAPVQPMPVAGQIHNAAAPEAVVVHFVATFPGAPPAQAVAAQVGAAFVVLARAGDGTHHLTLLLQPPDLGELRITVEQGKDSPAKVAVTAVNPSTLLALLRDQPALNQALDSAGISSDGRVLTFHLATVRDPAPVVATLPTQNQGDGGQSPGGGQNAGVPGQSPQTQSGSGGRGGQDQHHPRNEPPAPAWLTDMPQIEQSPTPTRQTLTAIDITA